MYDSGPESAVKRLKRNMTLDFNGPSSKAKKTSVLLQSPDLNMLKLASPELEKMIIQANSGMVTTTPTPTQFMFPKHVTEEQEAYARGFVDALAQLQGQQPGDCDSKSGVKLVLQPPSVPKLTSSEAPNENNAVSLSNAIGQSFPPNSTVPQSGTLPTLPADLRNNSQQLTATTTLPNGVVLSSAAAALPVSSASSGAGGAPGTKRGLPNNMRNGQYSNANSNPLVDIRLPNMKEEPQTVPCLSSSPPLSPINMESQERIKLERKRARNRVAARKCRTRKLERISRLEERVQDLKGQNGELLNTATSLREQVMKLKQQIVDHVSSGCQIMVTQNLTL